MPTLPETILSTPDVQAALRQAWQDSNPGLTGGHETGGFVLWTAQGDLRVVRWPEGILDEIRVPSHVGCRIGNEDIVASFHTHPSTGWNYVQEPSIPDINEISNDINLKGANYVGEFVISQRQVYLIAPTGDVSIIGLTANILGVTI